MQCHLLVIYIKALFLSFVFQAGITVSTEKPDIVVVACTSFAPSSFKRQELWRLESIVTTSAGMSGEAQRRYSRNWKPHGISTTADRSARTTSCVSVEQCMRHDPVTGCLWIEVTPK